MSAAAPRLVYASALQSIRADVCVVADLLLAVFTSRLLSSKVSPHSCDFPGKLWAFCFNARNAGVHACENELLSEWFSSTLCASLCKQFVLIFPVVELRMALVSSRSRFSKLRQKSLHLLGFFGPLSAVKTLVDASCLSIAASRLSVRPPCNRFEAIICVILDRLCVRVHDLFACCKTA